MDYDLALIVPSRPTASAARDAMEQLDLSYPVYMASQENALRIARELPGRGTKLIVSNGITAVMLREKLPLPVMELPFSGLEAALAVKEALTYSDRIVHIGTDSLYHYLSKSLSVLDIDPQLIAFHQVDPGQTIEEQTERLIGEGYQVIIGGYASTVVANRLGAHGIEITVDETVIRSTILNARIIAQEIRRQEENRQLYSSVLNAAGEPILAVTHTGQVMNANHAAKRLLNADCDGEDFRKLLHSSNLVDIDSVTTEDLAGLEDYTPVVLKKTPLFGSASSLGQVITIKQINRDGESTTHKRRDLLLKGFYASNTFSNIDGGSPAILSLKAKAQKYAVYDSTLLITGESGTGKELFAQSVHNASRRKAMPFVPVNCAALPESLIESELFGYEKGAFTGAGKEGKAGLFELADGGTIFLDEISEIPIATQSKLLRVIEEGDVIRVGGDHINVVDVRVICTSNKDLLKMVQDGLFKEDLYFRLSVLEIHVPPLRDRREDIDALAARFLTKFCEQHDKNISSIEPEVLSALKQLPFHGNVRELSNIIERMVIFSETNAINLETMKESLNPAQLTLLYGEPSASSSGDPVEDFQGDSSSREHTPLPAIAPRSLEDMERELILQTLADNKGNKAATARALGIDASTLWRKLKKYNV